MHNELVYLLLALAVVIAWRARQGYTGLVFFLCLPLLACGPSLPEPETRTEVLIAERIASQVDRAIPDLARMMEAEGLAAIDTATTADEARVKLREIRDKWKPIWEGLDALEGTYLAVVEMLEEGGPLPLEMIQGLYQRYCDVRGLVAEKQVQLPQVPMAPCPEEER